MKTAMKTNKIVICLAFALVMLCAVASAEVTHPLGPGQLGFDAVVISKTISIRPTQNANAKAVRKLNYGDHFAVMSLGNGWCECYLSEIDGLTGYALEDYLLIDPAYITTEESTPVYAWQAQNAKRVGLLGRGETYPIIRMEGDWLLISLRGAAGWILRPSGDPTGTARLSTSAVRRRAENYLLSMGAWVGGTPVTAEALKNFYVFVEFDAMTQEWLVTFDSRKNEETIGILVNDWTGEVREAESAYGVGVGVGVSTTTTN
jgi:hypothetical protein